MKNQSKNTITTKMLRRLIIESSARVGQEFLNEIVIDLASVINADFTFVGQLTEDNSGIGTVSFCAAGELQDNFDYLLRDTPCENVIGRTVCSYPENVIDLFPDDHLLVDMGINGYVGVPLYTSKNTPLGIVVALFSNPIEDADFVEAVLQLFATRAANEIERQMSADELESTRQKYYHKEKIAAIDGLTKKFDRKTIISTLRTKYNAAPTLPA